MNATRKPQIQATEATSPQVDQGRRSFLRTAALGLAGLAAIKLAGCAEISESGQSGRSCSSSELPASCSYRAADSARCAVWNNKPIELDGIFFYITNIRNEGGQARAEIVPSVQNLGCEPTTTPIPIVLPGAGVMSIQGRGYNVSVYNYYVDEGNPSQSWADVEVKRFYTFCEYGTVRQTLTVGESTDTITSSDGKFSLKIIGVDTEGRAILQIRDQESNDRGLLVIREGEVKYGQVGDKVYPITAHVVVAGTADLAACAEISISTCSELPHSGGVDFHW